MSTRPTAPDDFLAAIDAGDAAHVDALLAAAPGLAGAVDAAGVSVHLRALYAWEPALAERIRALAPPADAADATAAGDADRLAALIAADPGCADRPTPDGFRPLHLAAYFGGPGVTRLLLDAGADPRLPSANGLAASPLDSAIAARRTDVALLLLAAGRMEAGWDALEDARGRGPVDFRGVRVHLTREEGIGDQLLYSTVLPDLVAEASHVSLDCDPRLAGLLARTYPEIAVNQVAQGACDIKTGMGALPAHYRRTRRSFTGSHRRLAADPALVAQMQEWRSRHVGRPVVGISWRSQLATAERRLEYPRLDEFGRIFRVQGIDWVNLQYDDCEAELRDAEARFGITIDRADGVDLRNDQERLAALMSTLDAVIAPRNAVAMLAGALGVPCVVVGNRFDWFDFGIDIEAEGSPWFPSFRPVMRVPGEAWDPVLFRAAGRLSTVLKGTMEEVRG